MTGAVVLGASLAVAAVLGLLHRRNDGRLKTARRVAHLNPTAGRDAGDGREDLRPLLKTAGQRTGQRATLVQFSSAFCAPCRATRQILGDVAAAVEGVTHVEIDAESNLELVRRLGIRKTPTTLVLDAQGKEVARASGQPKKADVLTALEQAVPS